jgi:antitoxin component HigA of HigAB toxin-antitoxin module
MEGQAMSNRNTTAKLPHSWTTLQEKFYSLRPIHSKKDYNKALDAAGLLAGHENLKAIQQDYLEILSMVIGVYEDLHHKIDTSNVSPIDVIKTLMEENSMNASDLGRLLGDRSLGCRVLNGKRQLSKNHIAILSEHFAVNPALFLQSPKTSQNTPHSIAM